MKSILSAAAVLLICYAANGDTILLKSGESVEGLILREDAENYYIKVKVTKSIKEEKIIAKADVQSIEKETEDSKAFAGIVGLVPTPDLLEIEEYTARIETVTAFIGAYSDSPLMAEAEKILAELQNEFEAVSAGGAKMEGLMINEENYAANAYAFDEVISATRIHADIARRDFLGALRRFEDYEANFSLAAGRGEVVEKIKQVLVVHGGSIQQSLNSFDKRMEMRATGLERMNPEDRSKSKKALETLQAAIRAKFEKEKAANETWITPDTNLKESLIDALRQVESQMSKLESEKTTPALEKPLEEVYRETWASVISGDAASKKALLSEARNARLPEIYLEKLAERAGIALN